MFTEIMTSADSAGVRCSDGWLSHFLPCSRSSFAPHLPSFICFISGDMLADVKAEKRLMLYLPYLLN